ncbi:formyltetrahydrofolate deformylase, partial [Pseudomaricurvus alkylphenolicus]|uniref:formyltetrahydrofolate deformylase n=1 Tax=Pseudomaricurvus alkylphenolicus TaxID=1306991 RepID=UPI00142405C2
SGLMQDLGAFITEISHYSDQQTNTFFSRTVFDDRDMKVTIVEFKQALAELASALEMDYTIRPTTYKPRVLLAVSKYDHCLNVLLTKWKSGALEIDIAGVISNHDDCRAMAEFYGLPYHHLPISKDTKPQQEAQILDLMDTYKVDLLVLARYMQILSDDLCAKLEGRAINIHHSFLPSFKGAKPYHQAHERGVKVIGATAHYVTADLDEGPIIVQEVKPIDHRMTAEEMVHAGHDIEATALSHAVKLHCQERVLMNGHRTVIL